MRRPDMCRLCPSHPRIRRMELERKLPDGSALYGCVCGIIYSCGSGETLDIEGHGSAAYKLTAMCGQPGTLLPFDRLTLDGAEYSVVGVSDQGGGALTAVLKPENTDA